MFERLKTVFSTSTPVSSNLEGLSRWAVDHMLSHHRLNNGATVTEGMLLERPFHAGCAPSSRPYIVGVELMAKSELGLREDVNVIVMHRTLKRALDKTLSGAKASSVEGELPSNDALPEELSWLVQFRDVGWPGPSPEFWARYCVLTDNLEIARQWLDQEVVDGLCEAPQALRLVVPFFFALTRGKVYLRLQLEAEDDGIVSHYVLDNHEELSARALKLFGR